MPVFDTPISTDENSLARVLQSQLPVVLYLYKTPSPILEDALKQVAKEHVGELLVTRVDVNASPAVHKNYHNLPLPALLTLDGGVVESKAGNIRPADIDDHVNFLLGQGPLPLETAAEAEVKNESNATPTPTDDATFSQDVLNSDVPVLVDFWAPWCGPCHMIAPSLERLAAQYAGKIKVAKLNVDENPATAGAYQVQGIPMLLMFKQGKVVGKLVGAHPQGNIEQLIQQTL